MKKIAILLALAYSLVGLNASAESLGVKKKLYSCMVKTVGQKIENARPMGQAVHTDSKLQAIILYSTQLLATVPTDDSADMIVVDVADNSPSKGQKIKGEIISISCEAWDDK